MNSNRMISFMCFLMKFAIVMWLGAGVPSSSQRKRMSVLHRRWISLAET